MSVDSIDHALDLINRLKKDIEVEYEKAKVEEDARLGAIEDKLVIIVQQMTLLTELVKAATERRHAERDE